jgi:DNA-binding transcriptional LysR family regulator
VKGELGAKTLSDLIDVALRYFVEVINCGSIRSASDRLQIAPSAISRQIQILEQRLDAPLLVRSRTGIKPTKQGELVAAYAQAATREMERIKSAVDDLSNLRHGRVTVAAVEATIGRVLPESILAFRAKFPGIYVNVKIIGTHQVAEAVLREEAEIGIALDPPLRSELLLRTRWSQPLQAVMRPDHRLVGIGRSLTLAELLGEAHILPDRSFGIRTLLERAASKRKLVTKPVIETNSINATKSLVISSSCVTLLPPEAVSRELVSGSLICLPVDEPLLSKATIDVITLRPARISKAADALLAFVRQSVAHCKT